MTRRLALPLSAAALLAAAGLLPLADAFAGGGTKPAAPPPKGTPKPAPAAAPAVEKGASLDEIEASCDEAEAASTKEMRHKRYERVAAYVAANPSAKDAEKALAAAIDLAEEVEEWAKTVEHAEAYLKAYPAGDRKTDVLMSKAGGLGHLGGSKDDTKKAYDAAFATINVEKANPNGVLNAYFAYADWLLDVNDVDGAKAAYQKLKDAYASHPASGQVSQIAEEKSKALEQIGKAPAALPDGAKDLDGKPVSFDEFKGKVLLVDFWATWCGPCNREIPHVKKAYGQFHAKGFEVLGIALENDDSDGHLKEFLKSKGMPWRQVFDKSRDVASAFGVEGIPHTMLIDRDGKIVRVGLRGESLQKRLETLFEGK